MQKQEIGHELPIQTADDIERYAVEGHTGYVKSENGKAYLVCTKHSESDKNHADIVEESFTRKPNLDEAERLMEGIEEI